VRFTFVNSVRFCPFLLVLSLLIVFLPAGFKPDSPKGWEEGGAHGGELSTTVRIVINVRNVPLPRGFTGVLVRVIPVISVISCSTR